MRNGKFTIDCEFLDDNQWAVTLRSGEFKYSVIVTYSYELDPDDMPYGGKVEFNENLKMEAYGQSWELPSDILYQLSLDVDDLKTDLESEISDEVEKQLDSSAFEAARNNSAYERK